MRILHTSDWHLGSTLHRVDRADELLHQVERLCHICEEHQVDVLLVAGDIFECNSRQRSHQITKRLSHALAPFIRNGLRVVMVPGNHDSRDHFQMMKSLLELEHGAIDPRNEQIRRVYVAQGYEKWEIDGVQFIIVPYPERELLELYDRKKMEDKIGATDRNQSLGEILTEFLHDVTAELDPAKPSVLVTHIQIYNVKTSSERELNYNDGIAVKSNQLPTNVSYIALGHIHQCQPIAHSVPCWYSGSFDRMDFGEINDEKRVLLVDLPKTGGLASIKEIEIEATPFYDISILSSEIETLPDRYINCERAFVRLAIKLESNDDRVSLQRRASEIFPRWCDVHWLGEENTGNIARVPANAKDYLTTVMEHLEEVFSNDADLPQLKQRAQTLIQEVNDAFAKN